MYSVIMRMSVSKHAFDKHLWHPENYEEASVFFDKHLMLSCIQSCLSNPDKSYFCKKQRMCFEKGFQFSVGLKSGGREDSHYIRVVCLRLKTQWIVISAFPI